MLLVLRLAAARACAAGRSRSAAGRGGAAGLPAASAVSRVRPGRRLEASVLSPVERHAGV